MMRRELAVPLVLIALAAGSIIPATAEEAQISASTKTVSGAFTVSMTPSGEGGPVGQYQLDKTYSGPLEATASGTMLTAMGNVVGSAAYTAIEQVQGSLDGKAGSFSLVHRGVMDRDAQSLQIMVVPDSGSGELTGLSGTMDIRIEDGQHFYDFDYRLDATGQ